MKRPGNGDILEIPLKKGFGYGYAKFLNSKKTWYSRNLPDVLRIYMFNSPDPVSDVTEIADRELLLAPVAITGSSGIKNAGWHILGNEPISEDDKFLPHVKSGWPHLVPKPEKWVFYEDLGDTTKMHFAEYEQVRHLEYARALHISIVPFRITMELLKLEGKDIMSKIDKLDWLEEVEYNQSIEIPPYLKQSPSIRGRAINEK